MLAVSLLVVARLSGEVVIHVVPDVFAAGLIHVAAGAVAARVLLLGRFTADLFHLISDARLFDRNFIPRFALDEPFGFEGFAQGDSSLQLPSTWEGPAANLSLELLVARAVIAQVAHLLLTGPLVGPAAAHRCRPSRRCRRVDDRVR